MQKTNAAVKGFSKAAKKAKSKPKPVMPPQAAPPPEAPMGVGAAPKSNYTVQYPPRGPMV